MADELFEYLVIANELAKIKLCKELDAEVVGGIKEVNNLIDLFSKSE